MVICFIVLLLIVVKNVDPTLKIFLNKKIATSGGVEILVPAPLKIIRKKLKKLKIK